ncbi:MAG: hypothetical protein IJM17_00730 [Firmicutes bacterium]|nr:hypothetical protein [Bacillota bacterium]
MDRKKLKRLIIIAAIVILAAAYLMALIQTRQEQAAQNEPVQQGNLLPTEQSQQIVQDLQTAQEQKPQETQAQPQTQQSAEKPAEQPAGQQEQKPEEKPQQSEQKPSEQKPEEKPAEQTVTEPPKEEKPAEEVKVYFRSKKLLEQHYEKHGKEMGFASAEEYEAAACAVVNDPRALHKTEKEDGDDVYYIEETNEFVVVSVDGYIRTYFLPSSGKKYYDKQ